MTTAEDFFLGWPGPKAPVFISTGDSASAAATKVSGEERSGVVAGSGSAEETVGVSAVGSAGVGVASAVGPVGTGVVSGAGASVARGSVAGVGVSLGASVSVGAVLSTTGMLAVGSAAGASGAGGGVVGSGTFSAATSGAGLVSFCGLLSMDFLKLVFYLWLF